MAFDVSPSVKTSEFDLTGIIPALADGEGAISGPFRWGPFGQRVLCDQETTLSARFGTPTSFNAETFFTAASFLAYSNQLWVSRSGNTAGKSPILTCTITSGNATVLASNTLSLNTGMIVIGSSNNGVVLNSTIASIVNSTAFTLNSSSGATANSIESLQFISNNSAFSAIANVGSVANLAYSSILNVDDFGHKAGTFDPNLIWVAKFPGSLGNSLRVSVCDSATAYTSTINLAAISTGGAVINMNVSSNVATVIVSKTANGTSNATDLSAVNASAYGLLGSFQVTDIVQFGNNSIGYQNDGITGFGPVTTAMANSTTAQATFTIQFENPLRLITNQSLANTVTRYWEFYSSIGKVPGQTPYVLNFGNSAANDELHAVVVDDNGLFTGVPGTVLETYVGLSRATDAKTVDGSDNYYNRVINQTSQYVWNVADRSTSPSNTAINVVSASNNQVFELYFNYGADGADETTISMGDLISGYGQFASAEDVDVSFILQGRAMGGINGELLANWISDNITEIRKDCVLFTSPNKADVVNNTGNEMAAVIAFRNNLRGSSYTMMDSGYKYMYDKYSNVYRWIPLNGDIAGLCARTDRTNDAWWSPAGFNRGQIKNVIKLAWNPNKAIRDVLYPAGVNPVVNFPGNGIVLFGDKTLLPKASAFDRINVRRLFIVLEKSISTAAKYFLFDFNDPFTQAQFVNMVTPYLRDIQGRRGITDFYLVCNSTNNTPDVIDQNGFVGTIFIKPARSISFIQLNFVAVATGLSFSEVAGMQF